MLAQRNSENELICGLISISDRASRGEYVDEAVSYTHLTLPTT